MSNQKFEIDAPTELFIALVIKEYFESDNEYSKYADRPILAKREFLFSTLEACSKEVKWLVFDNILQKYDCKILELFNKLCDAERDADAKSDVLDSDWQYAKAILE